MFDGMLVFLSPLLNSSFLVLYCTYRLVILFFFSFTRIHSGGSFQIVFLPKRVFWVGEICGKEDGYELWSCISKLMVWLTSVNEISLGCDGVADDFASLESGPDVSSNVFCWCWRGLLASPFLLTSLTLFDCRFVWNYSHFVPKEGFEPHFPFYIISLLLYASRIQNSYSFG